MRSIQRNFLFIWICVLLGIAIVLSLTFAGCSSKTPVEGKATSILNDNGANKYASDFSNTAKIVEDTPCVDTDNGINKDVKGKVTNDGMERNDRCISSFLLEFYCDENGKTANQNIRCNCSEGKCV